MVHKFYKPKVSDYSNKLRVGLERCHLEQKNYCFKFDGQIQVGTMRRFLIRRLWNIYETSFRTRGLGANLDFWRWSGTATVWHVDLSSRDLFVFNNGKARKVNWHAEDQIFYFPSSVSSIFCDSILELCRIELLLAHLGKSWWNVSLFLTSYIRVLIVKADAVNRFKSPWKSLCMWDTMPRLMHLSNDLRKK